MWFLMAPDASRGTNAIERSLARLTGAAQDGEDRAKEAQDMKEKNESEAAASPTRQQLRPSSAVRPGWAVCRASCVAV